MGIQEKFENLLSHDRISDRDRQFCQSLYDYYLRKKRLTAGRRRCLAQLETHYAALPKSGVLEPELASRLRAVLPRTDESSWDRGFVESLLSQVTSCRQLSDRQLEILTKIEARHSDEQVASNLLWRQSYTKSLRAKAQVCARYYSANPPYFKEICSRVLQQEDFVPTEKQYRALCENKYAKKVLRAHFAEPKYAAGTKISLRSSAPRRLRKQAEHGFILKTDASPVTNAAAGTKNYLVLLVGESVPVIFEERFLKKGRF